MADFRIALGNEKITQGVDGTKAELLNDRRKATFKEVVLVTFKHDPYLGINMRLKEPIVLREDLGYQCLASHQVSS
jgi:hypothetical protein